MIYTFDVKQGSEDDFVESWLAPTELFKEHAGNGGSRLHKAAIGNFVAYAQAQPSDFGTSGGKIARGSWSYT